MSEALKQALDAVALGGERWLVLAGDCRELLPLVWPSSVALLLTDPPYGVSAEEGAEVTRSGDTKALSQDFGEWDRLPPPELETLIRQALHAARLALDADGAAYVFTSDSLFGAVRAALETELHAHRRGFLTWCKTNPAPSVRKAGWLSATELCVWGRRVANGFNYPDLHADAFNWLRAPVVHHVRRLHPTEKPVALLERIIRAQTQPGDLVLDPFCGSASTGEAALRCGRRFVGFDLSPVYVERARARLGLLRLREVAS